MILFPFIANPRYQKRTIYFFPLVSRYFFWKHRRLFRIKLPIHLVDLVVSHPHHRNHWDHRKNWLKLNTHERPIKFLGTNGPTKSGDFQHRAQMWTERYSINLRPWSTHIYHTYIYILVGGFSNLEKYEFVNGKDYPHILWKIKAVFETTNQFWWNNFHSNFKAWPILDTLQKSSWLVVIPIYGHSGNST